MKKIITLSLGILIVLAFASITGLVSAGCIRQMYNGESIPCPNYYSQTEHLKCDGTKCLVYGYSSSGGHLGVCVGNDGKCAFDCFGNSQAECSGGSGGSGSGGTDNTPLEITSVKFPFSDNGFYTKTSVPLDIHLSKAASITIIDNINGGERNLCSSCSFYERPYTFRQGLNDITIRAVKGGDVKTFNIKFTIDTKKPVITKTLPDMNKFASSFFNILYTEENLKSAEVYYGLSTLASGNKNKTASCTSGVKQNCTVDVDLSEFDGKMINYWFVLKDVAGNVMESRKTKIYVDKTAPVINDFSYKLSGYYVTFKVNITEKNLNKVYYIDSADPGRLKTLCTSYLRNNICEKKVSFRSGTHDVQIVVIDKAGLQDTRDVSFSIL